MSVAGLDGITGPSRRKRRPAQKPPKVNYPDFAAWVEEKAIQPVRTAVLESRPVAVSHSPLRFVRISIIRSGLSWFLLLAVLSSSAVGFFSIAESGRAAKEKITDHANQAKSNLLAAATDISSNNLTSAVSNFEAAYQSFEKVSADLQGLSASVRTIINLLPGDTLNAADVLSNVGLHIATAGKKVSGIISKLQQADLTKLNPNQKAETKNVKPNLANLLSQNSTDFNAVISELTQAAQLLGQLKGKPLPDSLRGQVEPLLTALPMLRENLQHLEGLFGVLANLAGADRARTYLILFQNNNELRPTGGFIGQFALLKIQNGEVEKLDIKSIYDAAGQIAARRQAPEGLNVISATFALQDANWFADFPTSAQALLQFFKETGDPALDGIIALNPDVINQLLATLGPVKINELGLTVTEDNFISEAQYEVANKDEQRERLFFPSLAQNLFTKLFSLDKNVWNKLIATFLQAIPRKDLQFYFVDPKEQNLVQALGADGSLGAQGSDILAVINSNIGGGKTDNFIEESRHLKITVSNQKFLHELTIKRRDTRVDQFKDRVNRDYLRIYVPKGATLNSADGFDRDIKDLISYQCQDCQGEPLLQSQDLGWEPQSNTRIYLENNLTVFANWVSTHPGEERTITLKYEVPFSALEIKNSTTTIDLIRQAGTDDVPIDLEVLGQVQYVGSQATNQNNIWSTQVKLNRNHVIGLILR